MNVLPDSVQELIDTLRRLPGLGSKSAARIAIYILKQPESFTKKFGSILSDLSENVIHCSSCNNISSNDPCQICSSDERDKKQLCVVEDPLDVLAFENGAEYRGLYHVLGGVISPVNGIGPEDLAIKKLIGRIQKADFEELIIATNPDMEGEATAMYIKDELEKKDIKVKTTRLARGLPTGADLEYADRITIKRAFDGRTQL
jgi:recombination protein RecR